MQEVVCPPLQETAHEEVVCPRPDFAPSSTAALSHLTGFAFGYFSKYFTYIVRRALSCRGASRLGDRPQLCHMRTARRPRTFRSMRSARNFRNCLDSDLRRQPLNTSARRSIPCCIKETKIAHAARDRRDRAASASLAFFLLLTVGAGAHSPSRPQRPALSDASDPFDSFSSGSGGKSTSSHFGV